MNTNWSFELNDYRRIMLIASAATDTMSDNNINLKEYICSTKGRHDVIDFDGLVGSKQYLPPMFIRIWYGNKTAKMVAYNNWHQRQLHWKTMNRRISVQPLSRHVRGGRPKIAHHGRSPIIVPQAATVLLLIIYLWIVVATVNI